MGKIVKIKENSLLKLKEIATNKNVGSKNTIAVNEAKPDVDEYEIGQESNNPPIGGNYCHVSENTSFNSSEEKYDVIKLAIENFGLTTVLKESGYILPNGSLLKFGNDGSRDIDHRGIEIIYLKNNIPIWNNEYRYNYVVDFMNHGAIRCCLNGGILDMTQQPTREQYSVIATFVRKAVDIDIDFTDNKGNVIHSVSYTDAKPQQVITDIYYFYNEGIKPQGNVQYEGKKPKHIIKENTFENWFGNSILKDENGNPLKMYHGTDSEFNAFSKERIGRTGAYEGYGFNFTPFESRARGYSNLGNVIEAYLKVENPMTTKSHKITLRKLVKIISDLDKGKPFTDTIVSAYEPPRYNEKWDAMYYNRALPIAAKTIYDYNKENNYGDAGLYAEICLCGQSDKIETINVFEKLGYDSAIFYDNYDRINTVIVFEPNQIKRTTNKTFNIDSDIMDEGIKPQGNVQYENKNNKKNLLIESQESKSIAAAKKLVMQRLNYNEQQADEFIRIKLRNDIPILRTPQGGKFILGVTRMFCDGELRSANDIGNLNSTLKLISSDAHINEYDRNLNGMSCQELIQRFSKAMSDNLEAEKAEIGQMVFDAPSDYEIVRIDSFEQASEYGRYTSWCVTHDENMFDSYTSNGIDQFYFCLRNGFENIERQPSEGCPLDEYGLSMIAVSVNENGMLNTCTCRWNHDNGGDDSIMNSKELSQVIGMNFFDVFRPNNKWKEILSDVMQRLANGESIEDVFDDCGDFHDGFAFVELNEKYNFINQDGRLLSNQWFIDCGSFHEGFAWVVLNEKFNFINQEGRYLSDKWFDVCGYFYEGFAWVVLNEKFNFINQEGRYLSDKWFDRCYNFREGFAIVEIKGKRNFINQKCEILSNQWFDDCGSFHEGFARVKLNGKLNFINQECKILSTQWFDDCDNFSEGFAKVKLNEKWNFINQEGRLLSDQWFDWCGYFGEGFAFVGLNGKYYKINTNGNLSLEESKSNSKNIMLSESQLKTLHENLNLEVDSSEIDLSSFKKKTSLAPNIWDNNDTLNSRVRLRLLDIADDFWKFVNLSWVKPKGIILTGSICNFNWSHYSDIDLHLIVDFNEIDEKTEFVKDYLNAKKNEWNETHSGLKIYDFQIELYVQDINDELDASGVYDLKDNKWIIKPNQDSVKPIGLNKFNIKKKAAEIMTIIDDMYDALHSTNDSHEIESIGDDAKYLWTKLKSMRKSSLRKEGESGTGNIVWKYLRRKEYLNKLWHLSNIVYDRVNSITEGKKINKFNLITESQESKSIAAAKRLVMQRLNYNEQQADEFIRIKLRNDLPILRTPQGGKFILGVTRMFCDGELRSANDIGNLNSTLKLISSDAHINEYDRNLNGLSCQELIQRFSKAMSDNLEAEKAEIGQMVFDTPSDYEIVRIDSFDEASEYGRYTSWCVTHDESMFDSYTSNGINQFYFCLRNGFKNIERQPSDGCPLDEYGLSMIAVSVNENGMLNTCTCRWNHDNGGDDSIMNSKELSQVIGMNFFDVFRPNNKWKEVLSDAMQRLANGESIEDVFDDYGDFHEGFAWVELNGKCNFITKDGKILSDQWFDECGYFHDGFAAVELNGKCNFITKECKYLSDQWFDECGYFHDGFAAVKLNGKWNFISKEGRYLSDQWFDLCGDFSEGFAKVKLNGKLNFITKEGKILSDQWFDLCNDFREGFAAVNLNGKMNFITKEGKYLSNQWFDYCGDFREGFAAVRLNEKLNFLTKEGRLLSNQWFNRCDDFREGFAAVRLNRKMNFLTKEGRLLSNQWFDYCDDFREGFARVVLNGKYNILTKEGELLSNQWFDWCDNFHKGFATVELNDRYYRIDTNGNLSLRESIYDNESIKKYLKLLKEFKLNEEWVTDGNAEHNPYAKRWKAERQALKNFICNYGKLMQSKESNKEGRIYKVFYDQGISNLIGFNYGLCVQWDMTTNRPKSTVYIRAIDRFTPNIRQNIQYDSRGIGNQNVQV